VEWLRRRFGWLRDLAGVSGVRPYGGPDIDSPSYPRTPQLDVPDDLKRAIHEQRPKLP
jgi:hypothetical protein